MKSTKRGFYFQRYNFFSFTLSSMNKVWLVFNALILLCSCSTTNLNIEPLKINETSSLESNKYDVIGILGSMEFPQKAFEVYIPPQITRKPLGEKYLTGLKYGFRKAINMCFVIGGGHMAGLIPLYWASCTLLTTGTGGIANLIPKPRQKNDASKFLLGSHQYPSSIQKLFRDHVFISAREQTRRSLIVLSNPSDGSIQDKTNYQSFKKASIGKILKVAITELSHRGGLNGTPIAMVIKARSELIRTVDGTSIFKREYRFESPRREISSWLTNQEQRVADTVSSAIKVLAEHIVHDTLLVNSKSQPWAHIHNLSVQESTRSEPTKLAANSVSCRDCSRMLVDTNSNQPTFNWQLSFKLAIHSEQQVLQRAKPDKTVFDIAIFRRSAEKPIVGAVTPVYSRYGLSKLAHRIETALKDCSHYFWSVRARYSSGEHYRSTDWAIALAAGPQTKPRIKTQASKRVSIYPSLYFHRFETPCLENIPGAKPTFKIPATTLAKRIEAVLLKRAKRGRKNWRSDGGDLYSIAKN